VERSYRGRTRAKMFSHSYWRPTTNHTRRCCCACPSGCVPRKAIVHNINSRRHHICTFTRKNSWVFCSSKVQASRSKGTQCYGAFHEYIIASGRANSKEKTFRRICRAGGKHLTPDFAREGASCNSLAKVRKPKTATATCAEAVQEKASGPFPSCCSTAASSASASIWHSLTLRGERTS